MVLQRDLMKHYFMRGVCQELWDPLLGWWICACPQRGECPELPFPVGLPEGKKEYKGNDLVKLQEALALIQRAFPTEHSGFLERQYEVWSG